ncbi:MAG: Asp-tRNA(Asn)/Glu-tRNA(Gln) amidotransferase subunit GatA [Coriobacteriales bacterium]|nr:Asp-tRNA(Asn)/Glu-tRNA(Gln) amidotransferase subunit GatA [Coriobacteriales bacterium]
MTALDPAKLSVADITSGFAAGEFSAREMVDAAFEVIEQRDKDIHAFLELTPELAYAKATELDEARAKGEPIGPLAAVPSGFKDNMNQVGTHTTCGSAMLESYVSPYDATCVANIIKAGGLPLGKLNMDEFAFGSSTETSYFGRTMNPWDLERVPGGSSGGSAAAVAGGLATITLGSDTGGSIRQPAAFCGVVGLKPTYGVVSRYGVVAFGSSLDQVGPFGKTVRDVASALNALSGRDPLDCTSQECTVDFTANLEEGVRGMKVGIIPSLTFAEGATPEVRQAVEEAARNLEGLGAELVEVDLPHVEASLAAYYVIGPAEAFSNLSRFDSIRYGHRAQGCADLVEQYERSRAEGFSTEARRRIMLGSYLLSADAYNTYYYPAQQVRTLITRDYVEAFKKVDVILLPTSPRTAFKFGEISDPTSMYLSDMFTVSINIAGNGGISLPTGPGVDTGLPTAVQLVGPQFGDDVILRAAAALETCYDIPRVAPMCARGGE